MLEFYNSILKISLLPTTPTKDSGDDVFSFPFKRCQRIMKENIEFRITCEKITNDDFL